MRSVRLRCPQAAAWSEALARAPGGPMIRKHAGQPIADWQLERYRLNELPATESDAVRVALEHDESLRLRLDALGRSDRRLLDLHPPRRMASAIRDRLAAHEPAGSSSAVRRTLQP